MNYIEYLIAYVAGALTALAVSATSLFKARKKDAMFEITEHRITTDSILDNIISTTPLDRCVVAKVHNSGGELMVGVKMYISADFEGTSISSVHDDWQRYNVDRGLDYILNQLLKDKVVIEEVAKLKDSFLSRRLELDNQKTLLGFHLKDTQYASYIVLASSSAPVEKVMLSSNYSKIETKIHRLRMLYEKAAKSKILF